MDINNGVGQGGLTNSNSFKGSATQAGIDTAKGVASSVLIDKIQDMISGSKEDKTPSAKPPTNNNISGGSGTNKSDIEKNIDEILEKLGDITEPFVEEAKTRVQEKGVDIISEKITEVITGNEEDKSLIDRIQDKVVEEVIDVITDEAIDRAKEPGILDDIKDEVIDTIKDQAAETGREMADEFIERTTGKGVLGRVLDNAVDNLFGEDEKDSETKNQRKSNEFNGLNGFFGFNGFNGFNSLTGFNGFNALNGFEGQNVINELNDPQTPKR